MKNIKSKLTSFILAVCMVISSFVFIVNFSSPISAATTDQNNYALLATAVNTTKSNEFENNKNPLMFDPSSQSFMNAIVLRKDIKTESSTIVAESASEFSKKYAEEFSAGIDSELSINALVAEVSTNVAGKFKTNSATESYQQKIEKYEYLYWLAQKYVVNVDWYSDGVADSLSNAFKRELTAVSTPAAAEALLEKYGTHVFGSYILGGKMEVTKYFAQDATYSLSETEKAASTSLNAIVDSAKVDAKINTSVDLSKYESNSSSSSKFYSKIDYHAYGGDTNGALNASDLFQYKEQFANDNEPSGFLYEAWTRSFNRDDISLKVISVSNPIAVWEILNESEYSSQIELLKEAYITLSYKNYSANCAKLNIPSDFISNIEYYRDSQAISFSPSSLNITLPENTTATIFLGDVAEEDCELSISNTNFASLNGNKLITASGASGNSFKLNVILDNSVICTYNVSIQSSSYSGGLGTKEQPFFISTAKDFRSFLENFASSSNKYFILTNDIDLQGKKLAPGGSGSSSSFLGYLDGNGHTISNATVLAKSIDSNYPYVGLIGKNDGTVTNLNLSNVVCLNNKVVALGGNSKVYAGILIGYNTGTISNCALYNCNIRIATTGPNSSDMIEGGVIGGSQGNVNKVRFSNGQVFGFDADGYNWELTLEDFLIPSVNSDNDIIIGSIVGKITGATLTECYTANAIISCYSEGDNACAGGIAGNLAFNSSASSSVNMCIAYDITFNSEKNVFLGYIAGTSSSAKFTSCYFKSTTDTAVKGKSQNGCTRLSSITLDDLSKDFYNNWCNGKNGPILKEDLQ